MNRCISAEMLELQLVKLWGLQLGSDAADVFSLFLLLHAGTA